MKKSIWKFENSNQNLNLSLVKGGDHWSPTEYGDGTHDDDLITEGRNNPDCPATQCIDQRYNCETQTFDW